MTLEKAKGGRYYLSAGRCCRTRERQNSRLCRSMVTASPAIARENVRESTRESPDQAGTNVGFAQHGASLASRSSTVLRNGRKHRQKKNAQTGGQGKSLVEGRVDNIGEKPPSVPGARRSE